MKQFDPKDPGAVDVIGFDFTEALGSESLSVSPAPTFDVSVVGSVPDAAAALLHADPPVIAGKVVQKRVTGGINLANYYIRCTAQTNANRTLVLGGILPVRKSGRR